jgi:ribosomal-protein-alanine N-acetyltransferase
MVDIGLGLRPDLTGRGLGLPFVLAGLEFARERFAPEGFRLTVAAFNERAILIYERAGFRGIETFTHRTNGGEHPFVLMVRESSGVTRLDRAVAADAGRAPRPERVDAQQPLPAGGEPGRSDRRPS